MWIPWKNKTGLAKAAAILATILSIATVSCGVNWVLILSMYSGPQNWVGNALFVAGWIEGLALATSFVGLVVVFVIWLLHMGRNGGKDSND